MSKPLTIEEILAHPAFPTVLEFHTPDRQGNAPVAIDRAGGPMAIAYEVHGTGPVHLVWIMGLNAPKIAWYRQIKYFGHKHGDKYTSLVFDNRGVGDSDKPLVKYSTSEMAKDVIDILDHIGWTKARQLHVVGVSMGGMISQELAYLIPQRIASLTLQSTASSLVSTLPWLTHIARRIEMIRPKPLVERLEAAKANIFSPEWLLAPDELGEFPTNGDRFVAEDLWRMEKLQAPVYAGTLLQGLAVSWHYFGPERLKVLGEKIPDILVATGTKDALIEHKHSDVIVQGIMGGVQKRVFDGVGHCLQFEAVNEYHQMLEEFWKRAVERHQKVSA
ncbi:uncharacterized protein LAJ45_02841 [Morchella importuna]|uniref:uncharacterized protein n=1 Tax=Morchella importuna TaxID=1174673 RepID=UPI001E8EC90F|nr:uncharacterized protein LAJ45_02841 [Morchella importuna]KAH8153254.1 hypothetical protein LAJ45_02841 [Morchella importuna]